MVSISGAARWMARHRPVVAATGTVGWTLIMLVFVDSFWIAALCGFAFGLILARSLPTPPDT